MKRLRYHLAFVEAYAAEGWRRASREKLKPSNELEIANSKILKDKRAVLNTLAELQRTNASDTQYPQLAASVATAADEQQLGLLPEDIYCSRCGSTDADENNDILICDSDGCQRAYHQQCQRPWLKTQDIPVDDEHWYCEVCLAVFNSLKLINSAFGTTCDTVQELFPELDQEEQQYGYGGGYEEEDEDEDDDFVDDAEDDDNSGDESEDSDTVEDDEPTLGQQGEHGDDELQMDADAGEISDQELKYLRRTDVIDLNRYTLALDTFFGSLFVELFSLDGVHPFLRFFLYLSWCLSFDSRSMRSNSKLKQTMTAPRTSALLGQRAAKVVDFETGAVVFGVIVDELEEQEQWHVVYYNDTMELLTHDQALAAIACANAHEHQHATQTRGDMDADADASDPKLILHGKRKRTQVNYRELNDAMFAGKADSDEEAEDATGASRGGTTGAAGDEALGGEVESDDEDYVPEAKTKSSKTGKNGESGVAETQADEETNTPGKRSRRERKSVDYHALNEGLLSY